MKQICGQGKAIIGTDSIAMELVKVTKMQSRLYAMQGRMVEKVFNNTSNHFNYNINAVSGTVRKSHPKSKFAVRELEKNSYIFDDKKPRLVCDSDVIVILQIMLIGDKRALVEYVLKKDFEEGAE